MSLIPLGRNGAGQTGATGFSATGFQATIVIDISGDQTLSIRLGNYLAAIVVGIGQFSDFDPLTLITRFNPESIS
jgi:hypothetical protein